MTDTVAPTEPAESTVSPVRPLRRITPSRLVIGWLAVVALFFIWQGAVYAGLFARFAEWQFDQFGGYFPLASLCLLVLVIGVPVFYVLSQRAQRERKAATPVEQGQLLFRFLATLAALAGATAVILLAYALTLSAGSGAPVRIDARSANVALHDNGPATLVGQVQYDRVAIMDADTPFSDWAVRFAPVIGSGEKGTRVRYFVQTNAAAVTAKDVPLTGTLRRNALRGDIIRLFTDVGYEVATPHYVLYADVFAMRLPYFWGAFQSALVALVLGLAAAAQRWRVRRLGRVRRSGTPHAVG
jgi:hypothetical protein